MRKFLGRKILLNIQCRKKNKIIYADFCFARSNYHFSSAPSTLRSGIFGIFLFKYADDILSSAWKVVCHNYKKLLVTDTINIYYY